MMILDDDDGDDDVDADDVDNLHEGVVCDSPPSRQGQRLALLLGLPGLYRHLCLCYQVLL